MLLEFNPIKYMFSCKTFILLCNFVYYNAFICVCESISSYFLLSSLDHKINSPPHIGQIYLLRWYPYTITSTLSPHSRLRNVLRSSAHTVSLPLRSGSALTQGLLCNPCPPASTFPCPANLLFLKIFFSVR